MSISLRKLAFTVSAASLLASGVLALTLSVARADEEKVVNVYNWSDYIADDTLARFTAETGIKVNYATYPDNETLIAKLSAGHSGFDVVFPSASFLTNQIKGGVFQKLDRTKLGNFDKLSKTTLKLLDTYDPGNLYAVPYMLAPTVIAYNPDKVKKLLPDVPLNSWALLFDPAVTEKLKKCGISLLDAPDEVVPAALAYLGRSPTSLSKEDLAAAIEQVQKNRANYKYIHSEKYRNDLSSGDLCLAQGYGGDLVQARDKALAAKNGVKIEIFVPKEGAQAVTDVMAVPADAPHPDNALKFINFILRPDVIGAISTKTGYRNSVAGAEKFTSADLLADPVIYPSDAVQQSLFVVPTPSQDYLTARNRAWTKFKTHY